MGSVAFQQTIGSPAVCAGIGVHTGERAKLTLRPGAPGSGIRFIRTDLSDVPNVIDARGDLVTGVQLGSSLDNGQGATVSTVEHLLAACAGLGIDNLVVEIDGPEVPIMDGSSALYCRLMLQAGLKRQAAARRVIRIRETIEIEDGPKRASLSPSDEDTLTLSATIDFESRAIGRQTRNFYLSAENFVEELGFARTFGFKRDVDRLQAMGLARGASLENAVAIENDEILNPEGLRAEDEFIRHKLLDAIGDLFLAGGPIAGHYEAEQPGHAINNALVRKLLASPEAWGWETVAETSDYKEAETVSVR